MADQCSTFADSENVADLCQRIIQVLEIQRKYNYMEKEVGWHLKGRRSLSTDLSSIRNGLDESMQRRKRQHTTVKNTDSNGKIFIVQITSYTGVSMLRCHRCIWTDGQEVYGHLRLSFAEQKKRNTKTN